MIAGHYRGKSLFAGRLFAGRLFGPLAVDVVQPPASISSPYAPGIIRQAPADRRAPALRRQQLEEDDLVITLVQAFYACGLFED